MAQQLAPLLHQAGLAVQSHVTTGLTDATWATAKAVTDGVDTVVVVGGDGLVHAALPPLVGTQVRLAALPAGTGNDISRCAGMHQLSLAETAQAVAAGKTRNIDVAQAGDRYFLTVLAGGFDALVNERANSMRWPRGPLRYQLAVLAELSSLQVRHYELVLDGQLVQLPAVLVAVANGPSYGGGLQIAPDARLDDGKLDVVAIGPVKRWDLLRTFPQLRHGTHTDHPAFRHWQVRDVRLSSRPSLMTYADGERLLPFPLRVGVVPGGLRMLVL